MLLGSVALIIAVVLGRVGARAGWDRSHTFTAGSTYDAVKTFRGTAGPVTVEPWSQEQYGQVGSPCLPLFTAPDEAVDGVTRWPSETAAEHEAMGDLTVLRYADPATARHHYDDFTDLLDHCDGSTIELPEGGSTWLLTSDDPSRWDRSLRRPRTWEISAPESNGGLRRKATNEVHGNVVLRYVGAGTETRAAQRSLLADLADRLDVTR